MKDPLRFHELKNSLDRDLIRVIHYGCESWYQVQDRPVAISSISIVDFKNRAETSFSLCDFSDHSEEKLLREFYKFLQQAPDARYVTWNMNSSEYGFEAISNRYRFLIKEDPLYQVPKGMIFDLDDLLQEQYGAFYSDHPKLLNMSIINRFSKRHMLTGKEESEKFQQKLFGDIKRSISEKANLIAFLLKRFLNGTVETKNSGPRLCWSGQKIDVQEIIGTIAHRFKSFSRTIRHRHDKRETINFVDEYDYQDALHSVLTLFFDDIRREEWCPSYAGGSKRIDIIIPDFLTAIELKHIKDKTKTVDLGDELTIDLANYKKHPNIKSIICIVFDEKGILFNPKGLEKDLSGIRDGILCTTIIVD